MPSLSIVSNVSRSVVPPDFVEEATKVFQKAIGKPLEYVCVSLVPDALLAFGGELDARAALCRVDSIGKLGVEENKEISRAVFQLLKDKLQIESTRAYIIFNDRQPSEVGFKGTTFDELRKKK